MEEFIAIDLPPLTSALFASISCALLGSFLVLRRQSLMGDAISHSVLPGIVIAYLWTGSRTGIAVFIGAALAGVLAAIAVEFVRSLGNVEHGASMGVVFSIFFAAGVVLIEQAASRQVDVDADCLLHGQLESITWFPPGTVSEFFQLATLGLVPGEVYVSGVVLCLTVLLIVVLFKELQISSFDPALATTLGYSASLLHYVLMTAVAVAVVASFTVVGSILVIAMIICPAAAARLLTDTLRGQLVLSAVIAAVCVLLGYGVAGFGPILLGYEHALSASGMMAVMSGVAMAGSALFAPNHGFIARRMRTRALSIAIAQEDVLGLLYRANERGEKHVSGSELLHGVAAASGATLARVGQGLAVAIKSGEVESDSRDSFRLSDEGARRAQQLVQSHRLWESFFSAELGLPDDHLHSTAMDLEHFTDASIRADLREAAPDLVDPHGSKIPDPEE